MLDKQKVDTISTVLGIIVVFSTVLSANGFIEEKLGNTITGVASGLIGVLVCSDKSQLTISKLSSTQSKNSRTDMDKTEQVE